MKIPDRVKVGPFYYAVERPELLINHDHEHLKGESDHQHQVLRIESTLRPRQAEEVFLHELLHAVDTFMDTEMSERQVALIARGLYMALTESGILAPADEERPGNGPPQ